MMITSARVLDRLSAEEPCVGALFTSYSFDPAFFEDHVLRAVLRLTSDPVEQAERYHHEARRALQETPVVAIVDAAERRPGRRLPFDILEVSNIVFHPKSVLLLYREYARLLIGSGNLTFSGYGGNTELFLFADLYYKEGPDAALLEAFNQHLGRIRTLVRRPGTQLDLIREELQRRLPAISPAVSSQKFAFLDSTKGPIIEQLAALLPGNSIIESIGMLAPFYERDDGGELNVASVFGALASRTAKSAVLDVGIAWDNPQVHTDNETKLLDGLGCIWTWAYEKEGERILEHLVPTSVGPNTLHYIDQAGQGRRRPLEEVLGAIEQRVFWMQPTPIAFAPRNALASAEKRFEKVRLWLHPATRLVDGRPSHRPLHAKLLLLGYRSGRSQGTLILMGSPNMSRRALLMSAGPGQGNVEVAMAFRLDSIGSLSDFVPDLVCVPVSALEFRERTFPELGHNYALAIDEATHDPRAETLIVSWSLKAAELADWRLTYDGGQIAGSSSAPTSTITVSNFALKPTAADIVLHVDGREYPVPILVSDLVALPAIPAGPTLALDELLMLLGRRIGAERAVQIAECRAADNGDRGELNTFFGECFSPTDVFRAWWSVAEDLGDDSLSVQAFRLHLEGALGVGAAWACMLDAKEQKTMAAEETWFYGAELLRALGDVELMSAENRGAKMQVLSAFCERVRKDLGSIGFKAETYSWVRRILAFYGEEKA